MKLRNTKSLVIMASICVVNVIVLFHFNQRSKAKQMEGDDSNITMETGRKNSLGDDVTDFSNQKCKVPQLNPYHPEVLPYIGKSDVTECKIKQYGGVHGDVLHLKMEGVQRVWLYYVIRVDDFHIKFSDKHVLFGQEDDTTGDECWKSCGSQGGRCLFCGENGHCCRRTFNDCPHHLRVLAKESFHSCVTPVVESVPENFDKECWNECGTQTGACPTFCGNGGYCCRDRYQGCPGNVLHVNADRHVCTVLRNDTFTGKYKAHDIDIKYKLKDDFFKLDILINGHHHEEYHAAFTKLPSIPGRKHKLGSSDTNILMVMLDSVSKANAERQLKNTMKYLDEDPNTYIMKGLSVVGDGTTAQLCAMLTGTPEHKLPEARRHVVGGTFVDRWPFIFDDLHRAGYQTLYTEDEPSISTFQYRLYGFKDAPTTKYLRPWWFAMDDLLSKSSALCPFTLGLNYTKRFFKAYKKHKKFSFMVSSTISHNSLNTVGIADNYITEFYRHLRKVGILKNTVVILFGDHGCRVGKFRSTMQGKLEERLPFVSITVPRQFNRQPTLINNLRENVNMMTSHFDIYATLRHIMSWPHAHEKTKTKYGRSLFSDIKSLNRTCADAGIEPHWCPCLDFEVVNAFTDATVYKLTTDAVKYMNEINEKDAPGKCENLTLGNIIRAGRRKPSLDVLEFSDTYRDIRCDSCGVKKTSNVKVRYMYEVNFAVSPSDGEFEINRETSFDVDGSLKVVGSRQISRTNIYGNASHCLDTRQRHLERFCLCKGFRYPS